MITHEFSYLSSLKRKWQLLDYSLVRDALRLKGRRPRDMIEEPTHPAGTSLREAIQSRLFNSATLTQDLMAYSTWQLEDSNLSLTMERA
jgi:hypothetical protein